MEAAVSLLSKHPKASTRSCIRSILNVDWHLLEAPQEAKVVANGVLPATWSCLKKGEMLANETIDALHVEARRGAVF